MVWFLLSGSNHPRRGLWPRLPLLVQGGELYEPEMVRKKAQKDATHPTNPNIVAYSRNTKTRFSLQNS
jgi:hypothetical protein